MDRASLASGARQSREAGRAASTSARPHAAGPRRPTIDIAEFERSALETLFDERQIPRFHARQVFRWVWKRGVADFDAMTDLGRALRDRLHSEFTVHTPTIVKRDVSEDGTQKFVLRLHDGRQIESVFIPDTPAQTFCISTQVGCAMGCAFCLTGKMGLVRHLTAGEIASQVRVLSHTLGLSEFNIVLMGMGEPLHNYDATMKALRIINDPHGLGVGPRRVTLSTVGLVPMLDRLAQEDLMPNLAISLHATTEEQRAAIVPTTKKYSVEDIIAAARRFPLSKRGRITFEYVLLAGVNDSADDARRLAKLLAGIKAKVNLIPLNAAPGIPFDRPSDWRVDEFARTLAERGVTVSVRKSRGRDIRAACGQLIVEGQKRSAGQKLAEALG
jgi:23S rRNA (adenine2503-C2)-methyltransferase